MMVLRSVNNGMKLLLAYVKFDRALGIKGLASSDKISFSQQLHSLHIHA